MGFLSKIKKGLKKITLKKALPVLAGIGGIAATVGTLGAGAPLLASIGGIAKSVGSKSSNNSKSLGNSGLSSSAMDRQHNGGSYSSNESGNMGVWARFVKWLGF